MSHGRILPGSAFSPVKWGYCVVSHQLVTIRGRGDNTSGRETAKGRQPLVPGLVSKVLQGPGGQQGLALLCFPEI